MFSRVAGRLVTGPLAFLIAGIVDLTGYLAVYWYRRAVERRRR